MKNSLFKSVNFSEQGRLSVFEGCVEGRMNREPFKSVGGIKTTRKLQILHGNVCGPVQVQSFTGKLYFVTFINGYKMRVKVYVTRNKSEVLAKLKEFGVAALGISKQTTVVNIRRTSLKLISKKGIQHETLVSHSPQQNGVAERT